MLWSHFILCLCGLFILIATSELVSNKYVQGLQSHAEIVQAFEMVIFMQLFEMICCKITTYRSLDYNLTVPTMQWFNNWLCEHISSL